MTREDHKKFLQQQILQIKANLCDSKLTVEAEELKQEQLTQSLYAVGGALEALAKEDENEKAVDKDVQGPSEEHKARQDIVRALKENMEQDHKLPPHVVEQAAAEAKKRMTKKAA